MLSDQTERVVEGDKNRFHLIAGLIEDMWVREG